VVIERLLILIRKIITCKVIYESATNLFQKISQRFKVKKRKLHMSEGNLEFENCYKKFADKVLDCVITVWETPRQIYDRYRINNINEFSFDNGLFGDIQIVLENLHTENEIMKLEDPILGLRYCITGAKNIVPFARKSVLV
jgi:hypothetical protein